MFTVPDAITVHVASILSIHVAPGSLNVAHADRFIVASPLNVIIGGVESIHCAYKAFTLIFNQDCRISLRGLYITQSDHQENVYHVYGIAVINVPLCTNDHDNHDSYLWLYRDDIWLDSILLGMFFCWVVQSQIWYDELPHQQYISLFTSIQQVCEYHSQSFMKDKSHVTATGTKLSFKVPSHNCPFQLFHRQYALLLSVIQQVWDCHAFISIKENDDQTCNGVLLPFAQQ